MTAVEQARLSRRAMLIAAVCAFAGIVVLLSLARWQATRATWKEALIADLSLRLAAPPVDIPAPKAWHVCRAAAWSFSIVVSCRKGGRMRKLGRPDNRAA
jgi:cytochrome oxidase assembly protein ShyY1